MCVCVCVCVCVCASQCVCVQSCRYWFKPLGTVSSTLATITVTLMFHGFPCSLARSKYLFKFFALLFTQWSSETAKSTLLLL